MCRVAFREWQGWDRLVSGCKRDPPARGWSRWRVVRLRRVINGASGRPAKAVDFDVFIGLGKALLARDFRPIGGKESSRAFVVATVEEYFMQNTLDLNVGERDQRYMVQIGEHGRWGFVVTPLE